MSGEQRRLRIIDHLRVHETTGVETFAKMFDVSRMTIHRDLDALVEQRIIRKVRGGATILPSVVFESDYAYRSRLATEEKQVIARAAAELIEPGMAIVLDDSSTTASLVPFIVDKRPLTLVTNALPVVQALVRAKGVTVICTGGEYDPVCNAFLGLVAEQSMRSMRVDLALLSAAGVQGSTAYLHGSELVRTKHAMIDSADRSVLLVDHSKFGKSALNKLADLSSFERVYTSGKLGSAVRDGLRRAKVRLEIARAAAPVA